MSKRFLKTFQSQGTQTISKLKQLERLRKVEFEQTSSNGNKQNESRVEESLRISLSPKIEKSKIEESRKVSNDSRKQSSKLPSTKRQFMQEIIRLQNKKQKGQFYAYCIVTKQSNSGIFTHERLLVLDSFGKQLKYFSKIPPLPLNSQSIEEKSKQSVKMSKSNKFSCHPDRTGISNIVINWYELGEKKQWKLTMGNKKMSHDFCSLVCEVMAEQHLQSSSGRKYSSKNMNASHLKKIETPFIKQIEESSRKGVVAEKVNQRQISNKNHEHKTIDKRQNTQNTAYTSTEKDGKLFYGYQVEKQGGEVTKRLIILPQQKPSAHEFLIKKNGSPVTTPLSNRSPKSELQQLWDNRLKKAAEDKTQQEMRVGGSNKPQRQKFDQKINFKQYDLLQNGKFQKQSNKINTESSESHYWKGPQSQNSKQVQNIKFISQQQNSKRKNPSPVKNINIQYQRIKSKPLGLKNHLIPQKQNKSTKSSFWIDNWLSSRTSEERAQIYYKFVQKCQTKVSKMMDSFFNTHLYHQKLEIGCFIEQDQIQFYYNILIESTEDQDSAEMVIQKVIDQDRLMEEFASYNLVWNKLGIQKIKQFFFGIPLSCVITYKSVRFYCKASLNGSTFVKTYLTDLRQYADQVSQIERICHISMRLSRHQVAEILNKEDKWFYLEKFNLMNVQRDRDKAAFPFDYIKKFIKDGVICSQKDIQIVQNHIKNNFPYVLQKIENSNIISSGEFHQILRQHGLNHQQDLSLLYNISIKQKFKKSEKILLSEIASSALHIEIRRKMQIQIFKKREFGYSMNQIYQTINDYIYTDLKLIRWINSLVKLYYQIKFMESDLSIRKSVNLEYVIQSIFQKLALRPKMKKLPNFNILEAKRTNFWQQRYFSQEIVEFDLLSRKQIYDYERFNDNCLFLYENVFSYGLKSITNKQLNFQFLLSKLKIKKTQNKCEMLSPQYCLLPQYQKTVLNFYLSHFISTNPCTDHSRHTHQELDLCLFNKIYPSISYSSTSFIQNYFTFATDLAGIKWFIKDKMFDFAEALIIEQLQCGLIWAKNYEELLIQIYDLYAIFSQKRRNEVKSMQCSLKSLQLAIDLYSKNLTTKSQLMVAEKAFIAGNIHFDANTYEKSLQMYETAEIIIDKINTKELYSYELNVQYLQIYVRRCQIYLTHANISSCLDECLVALKKCEQGRKIWRQDISDEINQTISDFEFETYQVLFRCYQIRNKRKQCFDISSICSLKYYEDILTNPNTKITGISQSEINIFCETTKMVWYSLIKYSQIKFAHQLEVIEQKWGFIRGVKLELVRKQLLEMRNRYHAEYRYSKREIYFFFSKKLWFRIYSLRNKAKKERKTQEIATNPSILIQQLIDCLIKISKQSNFPKNYRLNQEEIDKNEWMTLEGLTILCGYEYLIGIIESSLRIYNFQF